MKQNRLIILAVFLFVASIVISGCYTKKNGIVPCPQGKLETKTINPGEIIVEPA